MQRLLDELTEESRRIAVLEEENEKLKAENSEIKQHLNNLLKASQNKNKPIDILVNMGFSDLGKEILHLKNSIDTNINSFDSQSRTRELETKLKEALLINAQLGDKLSQYQQDQMEKVEFIFLDLLKSILIHILIVFVTLGSCLYEFVQEFRCIIIVSISIIYLYQYIFENNKEQ